MRNCWAGTTAAESSSVEGVDSDEGDEESLQPATISPVNSNPMERKAGIVMVSTCKRAKPQAMRRRHGR